MYKMKESGFTVLELLLSMTISIILIHQTTVFLKSLYLSYDILEEMMEHNENRQISFLIFDKFIAQAGHIDNNISSIESNVFKKNGIFPEDVFLIGENNESYIKSSKLGADVLHIRFETPMYGEFRDCKNTLLTPGKVHLMSFYIDKLSDLRCLGVPNKSNKRSSAVLAHKIEDFQVKYAYKESNKILFCHAECISNFKLWKKIIAVRISIKSLLCAGEDKACSDNGFEATHTFELKNSYL